MVKVRLEAAPQCLWEVLYVIGRQHYQYQSEYAECGLACVATCASLLGHEVSLATLRLKHLPSTRGMGASEMISVFATLGVHARAIRCDVEDIVRLPTPAVLHWEMSHFVVLTSYKRGYFHIFDPARGHQRIKFSDISRSFTGVAFELNRLPSFSRAKRGKDFSIRSFATITSDVKEALWLGTAYSLFLQLFVVVSPFFIQVSVDEVAAYADTDLLLVLAVGFSMLALFNLFAEILRARALTRAANALSWYATRRLFRHLVLLPLAWFERRSLADVSSRLDTLESMKQALTGGFVTAILDGFLSLAILLTMFVVSPVLACVAGIACCIYVLLIFGTTPLQNKLSADAFHSTLRERASRIETIRAISSIKSSGAEFNREAEWSSRLAASTNANSRHASLTSALAAVRGFIDHLGTAASVYIGVTLVLGQSLTIGGLFACFALKRQLSSRIHTFVSQLSAFRQTVVHADRLADIVLSDGESGSLEGMEHPRLSGKVVASNVYFKYGQLDSFSVRGLNIVVSPGDFVLLTGPSGCGKSTIMKLLAGLYHPHQGEIKFDGASISSPFSRSIKGQIGAVMQGDELLGGTIAENVAFFSDAVRSERIWECLVIAGVAEDVRQMPLQLQTLVGEIGSSLSAGQRQRLLIARALYRNPAVLLLDEATANVDLDRERAIFGALRATGTTIIAVTHRPQIMALATVIATCANGGIVHISAGGADSSIPARKVQLSPGRKASEEGCVAP